MATPTRTSGPAATGPLLLAALLLLAACSSSIAAGMPHRRLQQATSGKTAPTAKASPAPGVAAGGSRYPTVQDYVCSSPSLTKFCTSIKTSKADTRLAGLSDPNFIGTVFAPTDQGIINNAAKLRDQLGVKSEEQIWTDPQLAGRFVAAHVVAGRTLLASSLEKGTTLKSVLGQEIKVGDTSWWNTITTLGGLFGSNDVVVQGEGGNYVKVVVPDVTTGRAVVHVVDGPVIPKKDKWISFVPIIGR